MNKSKGILFSSIAPVIFLLLSSTPLFTDVFLDEARVNTGKAFVPSNPPAITELDPPPDGNLNAPGLVFEEYNAIGGDKYYDDGTWAFMSLPRGNVYRHPLILWDRDRSPWEQVPYVYGNYNYTSSVIQPALPDPVPAEGQYIAGLNIIHKMNGALSWPQILVINSDGYLRLTAEPPRSFGTSYRFATHNVGSSGPVEEFPVLLKVATEEKDQDRAILHFLVDGEAYTGAIEAELVPGTSTTMTVKAVFIMRRSLDPATEPNTGFAGMSSMFWKGEGDTPLNSHDEAHDADYLVVGYSDGTSQDSRLISENEEKTTRFVPPAGGRVTSFALEQRDRDSSHYSDYATARYETRSSLAVTDIVSSIPLRLTLHQFPTNSEYQDNIVAHLTIAGNLRKGQEINISYQITAY